MSEEVVATLGLDRRSSRLLSAVHEAGHAVVAHAVGAWATNVAVADGEQLGLGGNYTEVEMLGGGEVPLPEGLAILAAGIQTTYYWLRGRGFTDMAMLTRVLNLLAAGDHDATTVLCERWGRPDLDLEAGIWPASEIVIRRWPTVLRIGYHLARVGTMNGSELLPHLCSSPYSEFVEAREVFRKWRSDFDPTHRCVVGDDLGSGNP